MSAPDPTGASPSSEGEDETPVDHRIHEDRGFFGHPRGLATLFGLEMWERFSFLGMQTLLPLYFAASAADDGLGMASGTAASVAAAYSTAVYLLAVVGGWVADRMLGAYRSVLWGGILIALGHYAMAVPGTSMTWIGLGLIIVGTGFLKPNVSTMVGRLYTTADQRRDAGFALYYMGINIGSFLGPLIAGWLGQKQGWHWGFSAAAVGMTLGIVQYIAGRRNLAGRKARAEHALPRPAMRRTLWIVAAGIAVLAAACSLLAVQGLLTIGRAVDVLTYVSIAAPIAYFAVMFTSRRVTVAERAKLRPYLVLWFCSVVFNLVLFQSYSTMTLLAASNAQTDVFGWEFPSTWYNSMLGAFEVALAPAVAALWVRMGKRQPHASNKIAIGVLLGGLSFLVMAWGTTGRTGDNWKMAAWWIVVCYILMGLGDILLEATGMSATTKLAPAAFSSQTMAVWMLSIALANGVQAQVVKLYGQISNPLYFTLNGGVAVVVGVAVMCLAPWLRRTMHPVH